MIAVWLLAVSAGEPVVVLNVNGPAAIVQLLVFGVVSPKTKLPIVGATSTVTVLLVVMLTALKYAVLSAPLGTIPFNQFADELQLPEASPLTRFVQVPLWAYMLGAAARRAMRQTSQPKASFVLVMR